MFAHTVRAPVLLQPIMCFWCSVWFENCLMHSYVEHCHVVSAWSWLCRLRIPPTVRFEVLFVSCSWWDLRWSCRRGKLSRGNVFLHDNARPHTTRQRKKTLLREQFYRDIFEHPPYSPNLARSYFFLFPKMKEHLVGKRLASDEDLKNAVGGHMLWRGYTHTGAKVRQVP